jgi:hypothetical protein
MGGIGQGLGGKGRVIARRRIPARAGTAVSRAAVIITMSNSPVGWAKARSCAPCPRGKRSREAVFRVGTARNTGVSTETSVRRLCPPYE